MPLVQTLNTINKSQILVWKIDESLAQLVSETQEMYNDQIRQFANNNRKKQWLACRLLLSKILKTDYIEVRYSENGKPFLPDGMGEISFSHTTDYVAVAFNANERIGVDIEKLSPRIHKVRSKFISENEEQWLKKSDQSIELLYLIWGAKESVVKLSSDRTLDFKKSIEVQEINYKQSGSFDVKCNLFDDFLKAHYTTIENHMLTYVSV